MQKKICALLLALCLLAFGGCSQIGDIVSGVATATEFPVTVGEVTIGARPAQAAVLSPSLADVVLALGCETQLAAVSDDCTQSNLSSLPHINAWDIDMILAVQPDLVLLDESTAGMQEELEAAGFTVLVFSPATDREDFERLYSQVGAAFGGNAGFDSGTATAQSVFTTLDDINRIVPKDRVTTACYLYDVEGLGADGETGGTVQHYNTAITGDQLASTVMRYAGVTNVFSSLTGGTYDFEALRVSNPDVIFCVPGLRDALMRDSRFENFSAVQAGRVFELDLSLVQWQGRTVVTLAYEISAAAFPELLEENTSSGTDPIDEINNQVNSALGEGPEDTGDDESDESSGSEYSVLTREDENDSVLRLQERLDELGYLNDEYNGYFGEVTEEAVKAFQKAHGLEETGVADAETQERLFAADAKPAAAKPTPEPTAEPDSEPTPESTEEPAE